MPTDVIMPQMGESIFEGTITKWLKKAGDRVEKDEPLFEISTDKVDAEIPSPVSGVLSAIQVPEGATVGINTVVAVVSEEQGTGNGDQGTAAAGIDVVMPQMGESIFEGTITKWFKKLGDRVEKDEPLFEISTDKVDAEIPSPAAGILSKINAPEGATVEINTVVAVIGGSAQTTEPAQALVAEAPAQAVVSAPHPPEAAIPAHGGRVRSSPLVRRIARENNLDLARIPGTGSEGRITKEDALGWLATHGLGSGKAALGPEPAAIPAPVAAPRPWRRRFPARWCRSAA